MPADYFNDTNITNECADIVGKVIDELQEASTNDGLYFFPRHRVIDEFDIFKIQGNGKAVHLYCRPDGLIEIGLLENSGINKYKVYGAQAPFKDYPDFQNIFIGFLKEISPQKDYTTLIARPRISLAARLILGDFTTDTNFELSPSQIFKMQQQVKGRDGVAIDGTHVPHLG